MLLKFVSFLCLLSVKIANTEWIGVDKCLYNTETSGPCRDGIDNVLAFQDCGQPNSILTFTNVEILTYNSKGVPICCSTQWNLPPRGFFEFPGKMRFRSGNVTLNRGALINPNIMAQYHDYMLSSATQINNNAPPTQYCNEGVSSSIWVPSGVCYQHMCDEFTSTVCDALNQNGFAMAPRDMPLAYQGIFELPGASLFSIFFKGKYSVKFDFNHASSNQPRNVIGCLEDTVVFVNINS